MIFTLRFTILDHFSLHNGGRRMNIYLVEAVTVEELNCQFRL